MGRLVRSQLYNVSVVDPLAVTGAAIVVTLVGIAAGFLPARRATNIDPMRALRWN
jgi:putative ABC transport system permease protein